MDNQVRLSEEQFRHTYATAFNTWARLYSLAITRGKLPAAYFFTPNAFALQPTFPPELQLNKNSDQITVSGHSIWGSPSTAKCAHDIPSFRRLVQLDVAVEDPVLLSISDSVPTKCYSNSWFHSHGDYLTILMLAWAYILSARWAETMKSGSALIYTNELARLYGTTTNPQDLHDCIIVDIGPADPDEVRWWAAVLAQGQGWQGIMRPSKWSPWSVRVESSREFLLSAEVDSPPRQSSVPKFHEAYAFLGRFCQRHNIFDQSHAALAAVLLFPYVAGRTLQLPSPSLNQQKSQPKYPPHNNWRVESPIAALPMEEQLDRLLTLSCNTRGIRPLLLSVFYDPSVECNAITPWLQGTLAAIEKLAGNDPSILAHMCMERTPQLACIWLGCAILNMPRNLLQSVKYGQIPMDIHSAVWSGTVQSFIQQPVSSPLVVDGYVLRADECRLLFLCQSESHTRIPICQWKPFGATPKDDCDIEVRIHEHCEGHQLQYQGFAWKCEKGESLSPSPHHSYQVIGDSSQQQSHCAFPVAWKTLNRNREAISENATRNIMSWLRNDGCAPHEKEMYKHEWFSMFDSDSDDEAEKSTSTKSFKHGLQTEQWLAKVPQSPNELEPMS